MIAPNTEDKEVQGVHIKGVSLPKGRIKRMRSLNAVYDAMMVVDAEIYHFHDPELLPIGIKAQKRGKKVIFDSHEDVPLQISEKEWIPRLFRSPLSSLYRKYEESILRHYDAVVSVTPSIVERLKKCNPHTYQITNYPIYNEVDDNRSWDNTICFTGGIGAQWMHENILKSIEDVDVTYTLAGIVEGEYLKKLQAMPSWRKVIYKGVVTSKEVSVIQQGSLAGMALNDYVANVGYKMGSLGNTKLFEYMMNGIPVIATDFILWKDIVEKYHCGICVNPRDVQAIKQAIIFFKENPQEARIMGDNGKNAVRNQYNWASQENVLFEMYHQVLAK